jgi:hypothetical protein
LKKEKAKTQRQRPKVVTRKQLPASLPTAVQKSYFMLSDSERNVLNIGLQKYRPGHSELILIGGEKLLKPALRLMSDYRLRIDEIKGAEVVTSYTRWLASVEARGAENQEVYIAFNPNFERIWLESKKRLPDYVSQKPANLRLRSQYALRLYALAKKHVTAGKKHISLEDLRKVLGLQSIKDAEGNIIQEAPLPIWANFRQRALDIAVLEINKKTDLHIEVESLERSKHRRVTSMTFAIKEQAVPDG